MWKAYKYRIYPSSAQKTHFIQAMGCVRYLYNKGLESKIKAYKETGKLPSCFDLIKGLLLEQKKKYEWLREPNAQSLQAVFINLENAFIRFFRKQTKFPKFKKKSEHQSIQYPQFVSVDFEHHKVRIPKLGKVNVVFDRTFVGKIKTCTVSKTPTNKFFISILVDDGIEEQPTKAPIHPDTAVGIDLGIKDFAILSDGTKISNPKFLRENLERLKVLQQRASKKQKGSKNRQKANLKVAKLHEQITNQRKDFLHKTSSKIISENQTVILEDLNITGMVRNHKLAGAISDVSWGEFVRQLTYKSEWNGKNLIRIGRFEPSTKLCSDCGVKNNDLTLKDRYWDCVCGAHHDRDINAAINIKKFGLIRSKEGHDLTVPQKLGSSDAILPNSPGLVEPTASGSERPAEPVEVSSSTLPVVRLGKKNRRSRKSSSSSSSRTK